MVSNDNRKSPVLERDSATSAFTGHQKCAECHADIHQSHMIAPHSRTFAKTLDSEEARTFDGTAHFAGDGYGEYRYEFNKEGLAVKLEERFSDRFFPLNFAVGSGKHAVVLAPRRLLIVHRLSLRVQLPASFVRVVPMLPCHVSRINVREDGTVNDEVVQHGIVSSALNHDRSARTIKHIPIDGIAAVAVIEIDAHRVHMAGIAAPILIYPMHPRSFAGFVSNDVEEKRIRNSLIRKDQFGSK